MTAERNCRENHIKLYQSLEEFVVNPGETLEASLSRAVTSHIHNHTFAEIARVVSKRRLEVSIAQMQSDLEDDQLKLMYELLGQAAVRREGFASKMIGSFTRAALRQKLSKMLTPQQYLIVCAYEHHLEHGEAPFIPTEAQQSVYGSIH